MFLDEIGVYIGPAYKIVLLQYYSHRRNAEVQAKRQKRTGKSAR